MANPTAPPNLVPPATNYWDTLRGCYAAVLAPYAINSASAAAATADVARLVYAAAQEGVPTTFFQWYQGSRERARR